MGEDDRPVNDRSGKLEIDTLRRELRLNGGAVPIGERAFDILQVLVDASGATVTASDLMRRVWPDMAVGNVALRVQISAVRKALGANQALLMTISGRGYRLLGDWIIRRPTGALGPASSTPVTVDLSAPPGAAFREANPPTSAPDWPPIYQSGECEIDLQQHEFRLSGVVVPIGRRAFDIMVALVESANQLVTRDHLLERVWSGADVGDNVIDVHISAIRKALGPCRAMVKTISGRGFRLTGAWTTRNSDAPTMPSPGPRIGGSTNLPAPVDHLVGRAASLAYLQAACSAYRIVTLTGPGGIGKTALAVELARSLLPRFDAGVWLVELASLADPNLVPIAVSEAVGISSSAASPEAVARNIGPRQLLLVLDNCEHLVDAAAQLADCVVRIAPNAVILATSRETLQTQGEHVYRVPPLDVPQHDTNQSAEILGNSAVQLFVERAKASHVDGLHEARNLRLIAEICRQLDGIPLAIEFAAARTFALGLTHIVAGLSDRFALLKAGRRTALPRHQTLRTVMDWSYALLQAWERLLLHRLAIFSGGFSLDAVFAVMPEDSQTQIVNGIVSLFEKSMITADRASPSGRWRLLETVRAYVLEKLVEGGEAQTVARRHAEYFRDFFNASEANGAWEGGSSSLPRFIREVDNLRAALTWAFSTSGDVGLGAALTAAAVNFWLAASLLHECNQWTAKALADLGDANDHQEMVLHIGLGLSSLLIQGTTPVPRANLMRALSIAETLGSTEYQKRAVFGLWWFNMRSIELRNAVQLARRYAELSRAGTDSTATNHANLMIGMSMTHLGEYSDAASSLEQAIRTYPVEQRKREMASTGADTLATAFSYLSIVQFQRGLIDTAIRSAERSIEEAKDIGQPSTLCLVLARHATLLFPDVGAFCVAKRHIAVVQELADRYDVGPFRALALCARGRVLSMCGEPALGAAALRCGLARLEGSGYQLISRAHLAEALMAAGKTDEGLVESEAALRFGEQTEYGWFLPELLRIHGSLLAVRRPDDPASEQQFRHAIELAHQQGALYWELCAALGLSELWQTQGRQTEAHALLAPICQRFTEGFSAPVLVRAHAMLRAIEGRV